MSFTREITRLTFGFLLALLVVTVAAAYWMIFGATSLLQRSDNPRLVEAEARILRGSLSDRNGLLLAQTQAGDNGRVSRTYFYPTTYSYLGYYSQRYGAGGAEAAYDALLSGKSTPLTFEQLWQTAVLHIPQHGTNLRLTLDLRMQTALHELIGNATGAAVILSVPDGEVLALVSLPTFDPNHLDETWETLTTAPEKPFFNRTLQGLYQPAALLQTPLLAAAHASGLPLDQPLDDAALPVQIADTLQTCLSTPPTTPLTVVQAFQWACPHPFLALTEQLGVQRLNAILNRFQLLTPPHLTGFTPPTEAPALSLTLDNALRNALGQGELTANPLTMALMAAAIANQGNAPALHTLYAQQVPHSTAWQTEATSTNSEPWMTAETATQLAAWWRTNVTAGAASAAQQANLPISGQVAVGYSGTGAATWFVGFAPVDAANSLALALVIENTTDSAAVAQLGGQALQQAATYWQAVER